MELGLGGVGLLDEGGRELGLGGVGLLDEGGRELGLGGVGLLDEGGRELGLGGVLGEGEREQQGAVMRGSGQGPTHPPMTHSPHA